MKATREEALKAVEAVDDVKKDKLRQHLVLVEQAAVDKEILTSDPHWNIFLQEIQKTIDDSEKNLESLKEQHEDPALTNPDKITLIKNAILMNKQDISTLKRVIKLPKDIIEEGKKAKFSLTNLFGKG